MSLEHLNKVMYAQNAVQIVEPALKTQINVHPAIKDLRFYHPIPLSKTSMNVVALLTILLILKL